MKFTYKTVCAACRRRVEITPAESALQTLLSKLAVWDRCPACGTTLKLELVQGLLQSSPSLPPPDIADRLSRERTVPAVDTPAAGAPTGDGPVFETPAALSRGPSTRPVTETWAGPPIDGSPSEPAQIGAGLVQPAATRPINPAGFASPSIPAATVPPSKPPAPPFPVRKDAAMGAEGAPSAAESGPRPAAGFPPPALSRPIEVDPGLAPLSAKPSWSSSPTANTPPFQVLLGGRRGGGSRSSVGGRDPLARFSQLPKSMQMAIIAGLMVLAVVIIAWPTGKPRTTNRPASTIAPKQTTPSTKATPSTESTTPAEPAASTTTDSAPRTAVDSNASIKPEP
jgi:hypothetical protein